MIATIIVGYKNEQLTISYVKKELVKIKQDNVIIIVNNSATEESNQQLADELDGQIVYDIKKKIDNTLRLFVIDVKDNLGFAKANNLGFVFLIEHFSECQYVLFSNNDIKIKDNNVVDILIDILEHDNNIGVITPNIVGINGKRQTPQKKPYLWNTLWDVWMGILFRSLYSRWSNNAHYAENAKEGYHYTFAESFFMSRVADFNKCGMFDPATFLYAEGLCLSERLLAVGLKCYFCPTVTVIHENGTTTRQKHKTSKINLMMTKANNHYWKTYRGYPWYMLQLAIFSSRIRGIFTNVKDYITKL